MRGGVTRGRGCARDSPGEGSGRLDEVQYLEYAGLAGGVLAAIAFPFFVVWLHGRRDRRRNRKAGMRRTDKIHL